MSCVTTALRPVPFEDDMLGYLPMLQLLADNPIVGLNQSDSEDDERDDDGQKSSSDYCADDCHAKRVYATWEPWNILAAWHAQYDDWMRAHRRAMEDPHQRHAFMQRALNALQIDKLPSSWDLLSDEEYVRLAKAASEICNGPYNALSDIMRMDEEYMSNPMCVLVPRLRKYGFRGALRFPLFDQYQITLEPWSRLAKHYLHVTDIRHYDEFSEENMKLSMQKWIIKTAAKIAEIDHKHDDMVLNHLRAEFQLDDAICRELHSKVSEFREMRSSINASST